MYVVFDSLQYVLNPTFTSKLINTLDSSAKLSRAYDGTTYLPGKLIVVLTVTLDIAELKRNAVLIKLLKQS